MKIKEDKMRLQKGYTLIKIMIVVVVIFGLIPWAWNAKKLASCDFESNYKCEAIHGVGLVFPPASIVTVWFDDDEPTEAMTR